MKIINIEQTRIEKTDLGFEHWVDVTYQVPILKNEYTVKLLLLMECKIEDQEVIEYLVSTWKYRDLVLHSLQMYEVENNVINSNLF
ncbi:hypothetical protein GEZ73_08260 [Streptococcus mitis]|uniref:DUF7720 domain-containing protein n=2 Tax=Streptococcus mitis TaxID=28037 RepID=A0A6L5H433_STRMT|nr:hypothetical protein [Streptococcus mitis]MQP59818.1 hypothetical protein [Streptococcus mitis]MQP69315.1 hypothetical protein [Streptococcus mitis]MQP72213.1 hypothetical protein [Streptococcus mitis]MQP87477.1 hypothetical protein [Streptococcus mitis]MQP88771.1 hypothetical protein [Streptococcus mitis]